MGPLNLCRMLSSIHDPDGRSQANDPRRTRFAIAVAIVALISASILAACSTVQSDNPIGIGTGPNSLKQSPCACMLLPNAAKGMTSLFQEG